MATMVKCPECGTEFRKPFFGEKRSGMGITFSAIGDLKCPNCGYKAHTSEFVNAEKGQEGK